MLPINSGAFFVKREISSFCGILSINSPLTRDRKSDIILLREVKIKEG